MFYSKSTGGFYAREVHGKNMPSDVVEITEAEHTALLAGQSSRTVIVADEAGRPILQSAPSEQLAAVERDWRDAEVSSTEWLVARHRDEQDMQLVTTLTPAQFTDLLEYRQALRDWPQAVGFPDQLLRPKEPSWVQEQLR